MKFSFYSGGFVTVGYEALDDEQDCVWDEENDINNLG
jgi:hypothetical protein